MKREDDQKLWDLLGQAAEPKISPFFARNVLRKIRKPRGIAATSAWWFNLRWLIPAAGMAAALIAAVFLRMQTPERRPCRSSRQTALAMLKPGSRSDGRSR